jgi:hypothetical protein
VKGIIVERWTFLAGIVSFVVGYSVSVVPGWQFNATTGVSYDPFPGVLLVPIVLFILSFVLGARQGSRSGTEPAAPTPE